MDSHAFLVEACLLAADIGLTYLFYRMYRSRCFNADALNHMEQIHLNELRTTLEKLPGQRISYGCIEGNVTPTDGALNSSYTNDRGVIRTFKRDVLKSQRYNGYWSNISETISSNYEKVQFGLGGLKDGSIVLVTDPKSADYLEDAFVTTYDHFEPIQRNVFGNIVDRISGEMIKGYHTIEKILKSGTLLLGVGEIVLIGDRIEVRPPSTPAVKYFLTDMSKDELIATLRSKASVFKVLTIVFGITGAVIMWVMFGSRLRRWYTAYREERQAEAVREQIRIMREQVHSSSQPPAPREQSDAVQCVICLTEHRELLLRPCGHVCCCMTCYQCMLSPKKCPVCRGTVTDIMPVFIS